MTTTNLTAGLGSFLQDHQISSAKDVLAEHSSDKWHASALPDIVVFPETTEDVSKIIHYASQNSIPVYTRASGTGHIGGCVPVHGGILISMMRMNRILEINPSDGVAVVQPGVITGELQNSVRNTVGTIPPTRHHSRNALSVAILRPMPAVHAALNMASPNSMSSD